MIVPLVARNNAAAGHISLLLAMESSLHDLSQPLTSIACAMEILGRETDREASSLMLATAAQECGRAMEQVIRSRELLAGALAAATQQRKDLV